MSETYFIRIAGRDYEVALQSDETRVNGEPVDLPNLLYDNGRLGFSKAGSNHKAVIDLSEAQAYLLYRGREIPIEIDTRRDRLLRKAARGAGSGVTHTEIKAAMPGLVVRINAEIGQSVKKGQPVLILEAMKMENEVRAPVDGVIREIHATERGSVEKGDLLVVFE